MKYISREIETMKKNQMKNRQLKNTIPEMKKWKKKKKEMSFSHLDYNNK